MSEIVLRQAFLGLEPYVLIEVTDIAEDGSRIDATVAAGGGIDTKLDITTILLLVLEQITGKSVSDDVAEYFTADLKSSDPEENENE